MAWTGLALSFGAGCQTDSFVDPTVTGRWEHQPTTLPILRKINAIEIGEQVAGETPTREDLLENDFSSYRVVPGDVITVTAFDVYQPGQPVTVDRVVDQSGFVQLPEIGLVKVEGLLPEELSPSIRSAYGRLLGGSPSGCSVGSAHWVPVHDQRLHLAAQRVSTVAIGPSFVGSGQPGGRHFGQRSVRDCSARVQLEGSLESNDLPDSQDPLDLDGLLDRLEGSSNASIGASEDTFVDIDLLSKDTLPEVQAPEDLPASPWQWDMDSGSWRNMAGSSERSIEDASGSPVFIDRVLRIPLQQLRRGDSNLDIVIRPGDSILVERVGDGNIYIDGEIARPGPYAIPVNEPYFTLSRAITSAGGLGPLAEPDKVDLRRIVGQDREAIIRLDLAGIRNGTEPDVVLRPSDQIIVGTGFWNRPMFILREGFRTNYGFSLRLDRNFGNDVFGVPPFAGFGG